MEKIVLFTHEVSKTGAPILCFKISSELKKMGYYPIMVSLKKGELMPEYSDSIVKIYFADNENSIIRKVLRRLFKLNYQDNNPKLNRIIKKLAKKGVKKAIVNTVVCGNALEELKKCGFKTVTLIHEMKGSIAILKAENRVSKIASLSDFTLFPSVCVEDDFKSFCNQINSKFVILPQGYYKENLGIKKSSEYRTKLIEKLGIPYDSKIFVGAGTINFGKATDLLPIIAEKLKSHEEFHYVWLGTSNDEKYEIWLKNQISKMDIREKIHFLGYVGSDKEYIETLCGCEAFLLISREDSMPSVLAESMISNLPVIAFKGSGGAQELLSDNRGCLVEYMDIDAFCKAIENIDADTQKAYKYVCEELKFGEYVKKIVDLLKK